MDLIGTVRERYARIGMAGRYFTLVHRDTAPEAPVPQPTKRGLLDIFKPVTGDAASREKKRWDAFLAQFTKTRREDTRALDKRMTLARAEYQAGFLALRRAAAQSKRREADKKRALEQMPKEERPVTLREARRMVEGGLARNRKTTQSDTDQALRRLREKAEYDNLRTANRRPL